MKFNSVNKSILLMLVTAMILVTACTGAKQEPASSSPAPTAGETASPGGAAESEAPALEPVELVWYMAVGKQEPDLNLVQDEVNKYLQEKINATVKLIPVAFGDYEAKMNTVVAAGEDFDIMWNGFVFPYEKNARKGAFLAIDELLDQYAPNLKQNTPPVVWDALKIDGQTYAIPNMQTLSTQYGVVVQKRFADKYNLDPASIKKMEDLEPFLEQIKNNEPDIIPYGNFGNQYYPIDNDYYNVPGGLGFLIKRSDGSLQQFANAELNGTLASKWYKMGYIYKDASTAKQADFHNKGLTAVEGDTTIKPGIEQEIKMNNGGFDVIAIPTGPLVTQGFSPDTLQAISRTSKNPERAMMLLELVNTDKYLYNLLCNGIEGKHYVKDGNIIRMVQNSGYSPGVDWAIGSVYNSYLKEGQPEDIWEATRKRDFEAELNPYGAFKFNSEPVKTEIANVSAIADEYRMGIATGTLDFATTWPKVVERYKKAGSDKIFDEVQAQLNVYIQEKGL